MRGLPVRCATQADRRKDPHLPGETPVSGYRACSRLAEERTLRNIGRMRENRSLSLGGCLISRLDKQNRASTGSARTGFTFSVRPRIVYGAGSEPVEGQVYTEQCTFETSTWGEGRGEGKSSPFQPNSSCLSELPEGLLWQTWPLPAQPTQCSRSLLLFSIVPLPTLFGSLPRGDPHHRSPHESYPMPCEGANYVSAGYTHSTNFGSPPVTALFR